MKLKSKQLLALLALAVLFVPSTIFAASPLRLWVHGNYVTGDVPPMIKNDRTLVPLRLISEELGYHVDWVPESKEVRITQPVDSKTNRYKMLIFGIGDKSFYTVELELLFLGREEASRVLNKPAPTPIDVAPVIENSRTMVPLRAIAEAFGQKVDWDEANRTAIVGEGYEGQKAKPAGDLQSIYAKVDYILRREPANGSTSAISHHMDWQIRELDKAYQELLALLPGDQKSKNTYWKELEAARIKFADADVDPNGGISEAHNYRDNLILFTLSDMSRTSKRFFGKSLDFSKYGYGPVNTAKYMKTQLPKK